MTEKTSERMTSVTLVTKDASLDSLSTGDYRDIYEELRSRNPVTGEYSISFDKLIAMIGSAYSKALWAKYHAGESQLNRNQRNELRRYVGLPLLPLTVAEATAAASPDAEVWAVGDGIAERVIMLASCAPVTINCNGGVSVARPNAQACEVTRVTSRARHRQPVIRPVVSLAQETRRSAVGVAWREVIEAGLTALENGAHV